MKRHQTPRGDAAPTSRHAVPAPAAVPNGVTRALRRGVRPAAATPARLPLTALMTQSVERNNVSALRCMHAMGCDLNQLYHDGFMDADLRYYPTPVHYAVLHGHPAGLRYLLQQAVIAGYAVSLNDAMTLACNHSREANALLLLHLGANPNHTPLTADDTGHLLHYAIRARSHRLLKVLLAAGADCRQRDSSGRSALHAAAKLGQRDAVALLLRHGAPADMMDHGAISPLHLAVGGGHVAVLQLLLAHGVDVDLASTLSGRSPLFTAITLQRLDMVQLLLQHGANPELAERSGWTPLCQAIRGAPRSAGRLAMARLLLQYGASVVRPVHVGTGSTALHVAAAQRDVDLVRLMLTSTGYSNTLDADGNSPLHIACGEGDTGVVRQLLRGGARVRTRNRKGLSALSYAAQYADTDLDDVLLAATALPAPIADKVPPD